MGVINPSPSSANNKSIESATSFVVVIFFFHVPFWEELCKGLSVFGPVSGGELRYLVGLGGPTSPPVKLWVS